MLESDEACSTPGSSDKFRILCGLKVHATLGNIEGTGSIRGVEGYRRKPRNLIGELSMARPEEFQRDFDYRDYLERVKAHAAEMRGKVTKNSGPDLRLGKTLAERAVEKAASKL